MGLMLVDIFFSREASELSWFVWVVHDLGGKAFEIR